MKKNLKLFFVFTLLLSVSTVFAQNRHVVERTINTAKYQEDDFNIFVVYNDSVVPGDAIFVRMLIQTPKSHKKDKPAEKTAIMRLYRETKSKPVETGTFYSLGKQKKGNSLELLCGIPLSSFLTNDTYTLKISISEENKPTTYDFVLPLKFQARKFIEETIHLDTKNTAIRTDNSPQRAAQIEKLNKILETITPSSVYNLRPMQSPTTSTRYTSFFGDRRIYAYSNGQSSTSLHYGNDYGIPTGSEVRSCAEGKVVLAEWRNSTGWSVVVEHLPGLYSIYYHCSELLVKDGDYVKTGELLAKSGATGLATGPHLHWEMRLNMSAVRPEFFLDDFTFENEGFN